ncbi:MAG: hypothetical protein EBU46_18405, partial [Nitrosomonadaceae bacterium]|nr:hypothetical protein [Nitrosomonadaceae bacterium]
MLIYNGYQFDTGWLSSPAYSDFGFIADVISPTAYSDQTIHFLLQRWNKTNAGQLIPTWLPLSPQPFVQKGVRRWIVTTLLYLQLDLAISCPADVSQT